MAKKNEPIQMKGKEKTAFIIAPIGAEGSPTRRRIEGIIKALLMPVLNNLGFRPLPSHHIDESGSITSQIIEHLLNDDLVICDLTDNNPNVMYELAVRHAVHKPIVLIAQEGTNIPFDIGDQRTTFFVNDPLGLDEFKPILEQKIKAALKQEKFDNPISRVAGFNTVIKQISAGDPLEYLVTRVKRIDQTLAEIQLYIRSTSKVDWRDYYMPRSKSDHMGTVVVEIDGPERERENVTQILAMDLNYKINEVLDHSRRRSVFRCRMREKDTSVFYAAIQSIRGKYKNLRINVGEFEGE